MTASEHYCTLFDRHFLPQGAALNASLRRHASPCVLWVLCMDDVTHAALETLNLEGVRLMKLSECETPALRQVRSTRTYGEYCWTLACHVLSFVFDRDASIERLTYLDADVYFFGSPRGFFDELRQSKKQILITEHAYSPEWAHYAATAGRFCVQFVTFVRSPEALAVLEHWQRQTREACSASRDAASFGDQQYLDEWPARHSELVHVLDHRFRTVAPWNADHALSIAGGAGNVVFYHFHTFRLLSRRWTQWNVGYPIRSVMVRDLYIAYQAELLSIMRSIQDQGIRIHIRPFNPGIGGWARLARSWMMGRLHLRRHPDVTLR